MLTPGIEYFGAPSDREAVTFAEGGPTWRIPVVRVDALPPEALFAVLRGLIGGQAIQTSTQEFAELEHRDGTRIELLMLSREFSDRLRDADDEQLRELADRSTIYFPHFHTDALAAILEQFAGIIRAGGGGLYARRIAPEGAAERDRRAALGRSVRAIAPVVGLVLAPLILLFGTFLLWTTPVPWLPAVIAGLIGLPSYGAVITRTPVTPFADAISRNRPGSLVIATPVDRRFWKRLDQLGPALIRGDGRPAGTEEWAYLAAEPSGIDVFVERRFVGRLARESVIGITVAVLRPDFGMTVDDAGAPGLVLVVATGEDEAEPWEVPITRREAAGTGRRNAEECARALGRVLGVSVQVPGEQHD